MQMLEARCSALEDENAVLRTELEAARCATEQQNADDSSQPAPTVAPALPRPAHEVRLSRQCEALRTVLRQKESELGEERQITSQLKTAIKVAHSEYVKTLARCRQEVGYLQKERSKHEEGVRIRQQHLEDALKEKDADSRSANSLRALNKSLQGEVQRLQQFALRERECQRSSPCKASSQGEVEAGLESPRGSADLISPRGSGADNYVKSPRSPHGPDREKPAIPALRLLHLAQANQAGQAGAARVDDTGDEYVLGALSARLHDSGGVECRGSSGDSSAEGMMAKILELDRKLKGECAARRADQLAMMDHIAGAEHEKQKMTAELAASAKRCCELEAQLAEARFRATCTSAKRFHSSLDKDQLEHGGEHRQQEEENTGQDFFSSLLGVFSLQVELAACCDDVSAVSEHSCALLFGLAEAQAACARRGFPARRTYYGGPRIPTAVFHWLSVP
jgi:hypothetical protein